jgi:predicted lipoprotein with Yx(FWY)xxD motif
MPSLTVSALQRKEIITMSSKQIRITTGAAVAAASVAVLALVASLAGVAVAHGGPTGRPTELRLATVAGAKPAKIELRSTSLGKVLANGRGFTLYAFSRDAKNKDKCVMTSGCKQVWPVAATHGKPTAAGGVKASLLGTIKLSAGVQQVTYAGHPLYAYSGDSGPGQTDYVGAHEFGGVWQAVNAKGTPVG